MAEGNGGFAPGAAAAPGPYDFRPPEKSAQSSMSERDKKFVLAVFVVPMLISLVGVGALYLTAVLLDSGPRPDPPLTVQAVLGKDSVVEYKDVTFNVKAASARQGTEACAAGATDPQAAQVLRAAKCKARVEAALTTADGRVEATAHVMRFPDEAAAERAAQGFKHGQMRFLPQGEPTDGMIEIEGRYVVVTLVAAKPKDKQQARTALIYLNTSITAMAIWIDK